MKPFLTGLVLLSSFYLFHPFSFAQCAGNNSQHGCASVNTAIGNISTDPVGFVGSIIRLLIGFSGGIAILLIIASGYQLMTSQGNPEKVKEGRERLTSAVVGLLFIIFSVFILQTIGVNLLQLPGFGK